ATFVIGDDILCGPGPLTSPAGVARDQRTGRRAAAFSAYSTPGSARRVRRTEVSFDRSTLRTYSRDSSSSFSSGNVGTASMTPGLESTRFAVARADRRTFTFTATVVASFGTLPFVDHHDSAATRSSRP